MKRAVYINKIETAVPPHEAHSKFIDFLSKILTSDEELKKLAQINERTQIEKRHTVLEKVFDPDGSQPQAFYHFNRFPTTAERMSLYRKEALPLASRAMTPLLASGEEKEITHLIVTSCTGFYAPGLDIDIVQKFNLNPSVERSLLGYMGCYAAVPGLKLARHIVRAEEDAKVLLVNLELCTLHWRREAPFDQLVSFLLFADGSAVSLVSAEPIGLRIDGFHSTLLPGSLDLMGWTIGDDGFYMNLDSSIPKRLMDAIHQDGKRILGGREAPDFRFWAIHPGGRSILDVVQYEFRLEDKEMEPSRAVLRNYGNMSSPTVMFIAKQFLDDPGAEGLGCAMAFGPGLSLESFLFHKEKS